MRVLVLAARDDRNPLSAGGDQHTTLLARQLAAAGHSVTLVTSRHAALPNVERDGPLEIRRIAPHRLFAPVVWSRLLLAFGRRYDLVVEDVVTGERLPFFARLLSRAPTVGFWFQDNRPLFAITYGPLGRSVATAVQSLLLRMYRSGPLLVPSTAARDWLVSQGVPSGKVEVYHRSTSQPTEVEPGVPFAERKNRFVVIANFRPYKRMEEAIDTLALLRRDIPDATLSLIGRPDDAGYLKRLRSRAGELPFPDAVEFAVGVSDERKFHLLSHSKALTVHSPIEGLGWTIVEAGLCGTPVVVSPGVPPDAFREGQSGRVVREGGASEYARILSTWMNDEELWGKFAAANREVAAGFIGYSLPPEVANFLETAARRRGVASAA
jgi:glycosyltransferase involved in cell wall biosynthesis